VTSLKNYGSLKFKDELWKVNNEYLSETCKNINKRTIDLDTCNSIQKQENILSKKKWYKIYLQNSVFKNCEKKIYEYIERNIFQNPINSLS
jgi:hypothetical protein